MGVGGLQACWGAWLAIGPARPDLPLIAVVGVGLLGGRGVGLLAGWLAGLGVDLAGSGPFGASSVWLGVCGGAAGQLALRVSGQSRWIWAALLAASSGVVLGGSIVSRWLAGATIALPVVWTVLLPSLLATVAAGMVGLSVLSWAWSRGASWLTDRGGRGSSVI